MVVRPAQRLATIAWRSIAWVIARRTSGLRRMVWVLSNTVRRWFGMVPPTTSKARLRSMLTIWSGGMSQANWYSPDSSPFTREDTSGTSTKRSWRIGGRPPQYSS